MKTSHPVLEMTADTKQASSTNVVNDYIIYGDSIDAMHYRTRNKDLNYSQVYERDPYSQQQNFLYKRALFGFKVYTAEELNTMHWQKKKRIQKVYSRTQNILNEWKQQLIIQWTNKFFEKMFPNSPLLTSLKEAAHTDKSVKNTLNFSDLGVDKDMIISKLVQEGVLPSNFKDLK